MNKRNQEYIRSCLLGGAVGDALGWPVEFIRLNEIKSKYGDQGIMDLNINSSGIAEITDDTQMTIFTAEGLLRAECRGNKRGVCHIPSIVHHAYIRWLNTQGIKCLEKENVIKELDGWVGHIQQLYSRRAPGNSCISALASGKMGTIEEPINNSKGCGGIMRIAPVGLFYSKEMAFRIGCEIAAITHGHPSGYLSAGMLAYIISEIIDGSDIRDSINNALEELLSYPGHEECEKVVMKALKLVDNDTKPQDAIHELGEGWVGEEALAVSIYCSLRYQDDFRKALCLSVNHDGDSDSTGAITGNILGAYAGIDAIPAEWVKKVELRDEITQLADDLLVRYSEEDSWWEKYPGW